MDSAQYLASLRQELDAFAACLGVGRDLSAPVEHCGNWTLYDLANHLGWGNLWSAAAVTEQHGDHDAPPGPRDPAALAAWLNGTSAVLLAALDTDPSAPAWTIAPPPTAGFWQRRRCLETLVHRWDAQRATGVRPELDAGLADDGVAEVVDVMTPRQVRLGRTSTPGHAVRLVSADTGSQRTLGPGEPVATIQATAADLLLLLWGRLAVTDPGITWHGDREQARAVLRHRLTP